MRKLLRGPRISFGSSSWFSPFHLDAFRRNLFQKLLLYPLDSRHCQSPQNGELGLPPKWGYSSPSRTARTAASVRFLTSSLRKSDFKCPLMVSRARRVISLISSLLSPSETRRRILSSSSVRLNRSANWLMRTGFEPAFRFEVCSRARCARYGEDEV